MLAHLTILFPCMISVLWFLIFLSRSGKARQNVYLAMLAAIASGYFFFDACYIMSDVNFKTVVMADIVRQFAAPSLALYCWYYLRILKGDHKDHAVVGYFLAVPATMMAMTAVTYLIMGYDTKAYLTAFDQAGHFPEGFDEPIYMIHLFVCRYFYVVVETIVCLALEIYLIVDVVKTGGDIKNGFKFLFNKGTASSHHIQCVNFGLFIFIFLVRTIIGRCYFINHLYLAMILSLLIGLVTFFIAIVGILGGSRDKLSLSDIFFNSDAPAPATAPLVSSVQTSSEDSIDEEEDYSDEESYEDEDLGEDDSEEGEDENSQVDEEEEAEEQTPHGTVVKFDESLVERFRTAVIDKKLYLKNGLTVKDVCSEIGSNKTYISKMVNERFGMPFPNFINMLRVEYAKEYLLAHPNAKQEEIADECGFPNAAGFNRSFTKITGMTPRIWLAKNKK